MTKHQVYLGLGSNLGNREAVLLQAIKLIDERVGQVLRRSSFIETEPWGFESDNKFLNAAVCCETELSPRQVLQTTQQIERDLGKRKCHYDDLIVDEPDLKIPHPLMHQREFVMRPLNEIREPQSL